MAGFFRMALEGEFFNQQIVNVLHFRANDWGWQDGNPFEDTLAVVDAILTEVQTSYLGCMPDDYMLQRAVGVGYDDEYTIVTPSPLIRTVGENGTLTGTATNGSAACGIISLACGQQTQIYGTGQSKRNRGYLAMGPLADVSVDDYSHLAAGAPAAFATFAAHLDNSIVMLSPSITLVPVRIHEKWLKVLTIPVLQWRTYSDVQGFTVRRLVSFRRSRQPEA